MVPGHCRPPHVRVIAIMRTLRLGAILLVGSRAEGTWQIGSHIIILQLCLDLVDITEEIIRIQNEVLDIGVRMITKTIAFLLIGLEL